jgi:type I restriction enzyme, S subunit
MTKIPDGWAQRSIGEVASVASGSTPDRKKTDFWGGTIPWVTTGEINSSDIWDTKEKVTETALKESAIRLFPRNGLLLAMYGQGATRGRVARLKIDATTNQACAYIKSNDETNLEYLYQFFLSQYENLREMGHGGNQKNLNGQIIKQFPILVPPLSEQHKIAAILSTWDDSLSILTRLIDTKRQQKRALAEQLLTGKRRLKGFQGEWETLRFGDVFERVSRKNIERNDNVLTISGVHGLISQKEIFNKRIAATDVVGYYLLKRGEFAYNKSYSAGYDFGAIKRLNRYESGVVSTLYICFALKRSGAAGDFFEHFFDANLLNEGISGIAQEGARNHGLLNVSVVDFFELDVPFPPPAEQKAISSILSALDTEIDLLTRQQAKVQEQKRGLMDLLLTGKVRVKVPEEVPA